MALTQVQGQMLNGSTNTTTTIQSNGTTAITIDASQNVGINVTPSAWSLAGGKAIQLSSSTAIWNYAGTNSYFSNNEYYNGSARIFLSNGWATEYTQAAGTHVWFTSSASGTAGGTATMNQVMALDTSGNLLVGTNASSFNSKFRVVGSSSSADWAFLFQNSTPTNLLAVDGAGGFYTGSAPSSPYNNTTGSGANVYIGTAGQLFRSTSSLKYKENIENATHGLVDVLKLRSVTYQSKNEKDNKQIFGGLIAEEVDEAGLKEFVVYAEDGTPDALHYGNMVSLCIKAIQELNAKVEAQAAEIKALKGK